MAKINKISAFTLAEVLITLAIIGVVAAFSIPSLISNAQDKEFKSAFKKNYSALSRFAAMAASENGGTLDGVLRDTGDAGYLKFKEYFSPVKDCFRSGSMPGQCWHTNNNWYNTDNVPLVSAIDGGYRLVLSDGALYALSTHNPDACNGSWFEALNAGDRTNLYNSCMSVMLDVNGFKGPNRVGKDIFGVLFLKNGTVMPNFGSVCNASSGNVEFGTGLNNGKNILLEN